MLRQPGLRHQPAVLHRAQAHQHPAAAPAARPHRLPLREDEVHHRGGLAPAILQEQCLQREVSAGMCVGLTIVK